MIKIYFAFYTNLGCIFILSLIHAISFMTEFIYLTYLDYFGTIVFALSGVMVASRNDMDFFGALVLATATAIGGGTLRDILLDVPSFWMLETLYLYLILATTIIAFAGIHFIDRIPRLHVEIADAIGLASFTLIGTIKADMAGMAAPVCIIMGIMTGVAGGAIRDVLTGRPPTVLKERSFYATACFIGSLVFLLLQPYLALYINLVLSWLLTLSLRMAAIYGLLNVPGFPQRPS